MTEHETLDEAIDRVAAEMSAVDSSQDIELGTLPRRGVFTTWGSWRWAVAAGAIALATTLVFVGRDRRTADVVVDTSQNVSPDAGDSSRSTGALRDHGRDGPSGPPKPGLETRPYEAVRVATRSKGRPLQPPEDTQRRVEPVFSERFEDAGDGLAPLATLATLDIAPVSVPALRIAEPTGPEPLVIPDLVLDAPSESPFPRE